MVGSESERTTCIRRARWVIGWDAERSDHCFLRDTDVVFRGQDIIHIGPDYDPSSADVVVDGGSIMVMPGLISLHSHVNGGNLATGFLEEVLDPNFGHSPMYTRKGPFWGSGLSGPDRDDGQRYRAIMRHSVAELLGAGTTTVMDVQMAGPRGDLWCEVLAETGIRGYVAPAFQEAHWRPTDGRVLDYDWDPEFGERSFELACATLDMVQDYGDGRLQGVMYPHQVDTCGERLLRQSRQEARSRGLPWQTHCGQSIPEFRAMVARTGRTPVQWLADLDLLERSSSLAHAIYLDHHSQLAWHSRDDLSILRDTGATVAHCPVTFSRWGTALESFGGYEAAGVSMAMGIDTGPHNMLEAIRSAFTHGRVASHEPAALAMSDVFRAATVGGALALDRPDLGRIEVGAKADLVLVDLDHPRMQPGVDPLRALVFVAADRAVRDVYVDGRLVYADGETTGFDSRSASGELAPTLRAMIAEVEQSTTTPPLGEIATWSYPTE